MNQYSQHYIEQSENNSLYLTFLPILIFFGGYTFARAKIADLTISWIVRGIVIVVFFACIFCAYKFYFRSFLYTLVEADRGNRQYPSESLTFERKINKKSRIYERIFKKEMLCLLCPDEKYDSKKYGVSEKPYNLTIYKKATAYRLYYKQQGVVYCALIHPDETQLEILKNWCGKGA